MSNPILYKYTSTKAIEFVLEKQTVCFTSVAYLNDPFEANMNMEAIVAAEVAGVRKRTKASIQLYFGGVPSDSLVDKYLELFSKEGLGPEQWKMFAARAAWQAALAKFSQLGVFSLATKADNLLLWSHYASSGSGLVIGFDEGSSPLSDADFHGIRGPQLVEYTAVRAKADEDSLEKRVRAIALRKGPDWAYEGEVRCLNEVPVGAERLLRPLPPATLKLIAMGPAMPPADIMRIYDLHERIYPHAELLFAVPNPGVFKMDLRPALPKKAVEAILKSTVAFTPIRFPNTF